VWEWRALAPQTAHSLDLHTPAKLLQHFRALFWRLLIQR
jgi:hypothetical protein